MIWHDGVLTAFEYQEKEFVCVTSCSYNEIIYWDVDGTNYDTNTSVSEISLSTRSTLRLSLTRKHNNKTIRCGTAFDSKEYTLKVKCMLTYSSHFQTINVYN